MINLKGHRLLVVGGSRGIGRAAALMAAEAGANVAVSYVSDAKAANDTVRKLRAFGRKATALKADVIDEVATTYAVNRAADFLGGLDGLVVSAGIYSAATIEDMTLQFWNRMIAVNLTGTFVAVKAAVPFLKRSENGASIVIYSSIAGLSGSPEHSAYATSKGGQILFMRSMARELAPSRIRVNCVAPGWTDTDLARDSIEAIGRKKVEADSPLGRIAKPSDVAGATVYLLSSLAEFVTGITLPVDGGKNMRV
jgi:3-oxoacyl-[acyl-carrier protein] reductase